ncbi:hypothetical protein [Hymenobacter terricola]|uniref:hypothetical protein n=1 Tax=Hymenobacter terricola TaxID=2819236 RepID=UPI001B309022|nr:hypothetical protein [Hymenobacter terricola]
MRTVPKGIGIETGVHLLRIEPQPDAEDVVVYEDKYGAQQGISASAILVATGREPNVAGLKAGCRRPEPQRRTLIPVQPRQPRPRPDRGGLESRSGQSGHRDGSPAPARLHHKAAPA